MATGEITLPMAEEKRELATKSDRLLDALGQLRETETKKRREAISTSEFHRLADQVTEQSEDIFRIAHEQDQLGEAAQTGDETIEELSDRPG